MVRIFIAIGLFLQFNLCVELRAQRLLSEEELKEKEYSYQPPKKRFMFYKAKHRLKTIKNFHLAGIDTNAVYVGIDSLKFQGDTITYGYLRFFSTGEVFISYDYLSFPTEEEFNDLSYGFWEFLKVVNKHEIIMESYVHNTMVHFHYDYMKVLGDTIFFYKYRIGRPIRLGAVEYVNCKFVRHPVNFTNREITWK